MWQFYLFKRGSNSEISNTFILHEFIDEFCLQNWLNSGLISGFKWQTTKSRIIYVVNYCTIKSKCIIPKGVWKTCHVFYFCWFWRSQRHFDKMSLGFLSIFHLILETNTWFLFKQGLFLVMFCCVPTIVTKQ